jgi:hypothetical protein
LRKILILGSALLVFLLAACSSGDTADERENDAAPPAATAVVEEPTAIVEEPTALPEPTVELESGGGLLGGALNPLNLLSLGSGGGSEGLPATAAEADPALKSTLLTLDDLPAGYSEPMPGGMSFSMDTGQGKVDMAASIFVKGEAMDAFPESMVMSAAILMSGDLMDESLAEIERYADGSELEREIQEAMGGAEAAMFGFAIEDVSVLDASGLGDEGLGLHMVMSMDLGQLAEGFGADIGEQVPPELDALKDGIAFDMYVFVRGDHLLMVMTMWPGQSSAAVDALDLAELMDGRAEAAF